MVWVAHVRMCWHFQDLICIPIWFARVYLFFTIYIGFDFAEGGGLCAGL